MNVNRNDFSGKTSVPGGEYGEIHVSGSGRVNGDLSCEELHTSGVTTVEGKLNCRGRVSTSGSCKISGDAVAQEMTTSGSCRCEGNFEIKGKADTSGSFTCRGNLKALELKSSGSTKAGGDAKLGSAVTSGSLTVGGSLTAGDLKTSGKLEVGKDCEAERFEASGLINIGGLLNAEEIVIQLVGPMDSRVGSIGCDKLEVSWKRGGMSLLDNLFGLKTGGTLTTGTVEGDFISLSHVRADCVRGRDIHIGEGCEICLVEYSGELSVEPSSKIGTRNKI